MRIYSFPKEYRMQSDVFSVLANREWVGVYACRVSAVPFNQVWPGYQRPVDQTELTSFIMLASDEAFELEIVSDRPVEAVTVRPLRHRIIPALDGNRVRVMIPGPGQYTLEMPDKHHMLTVFVDPEKENRPDRTDPNLLYFGPGVHTPEKSIVLESHQTLWIDEGAVLYGSVVAEGKEDIRIAGRGILDNSRFERDQGATLALRHCKNVRVEGITMVDSSVWTAHFSGCRDVTVDRVKLIGMWRYNSDGCDFTNSSDCVIRNSFLRNYDDCIVIKGLKGNRELPEENILAENCVLWCDWGKPLEIGAETSAPYMKNITFRDCDIIRGSFTMMDFMHGDRADISEVLFENIRCEYAAIDDTPILQTAPGQSYQNPEEDYMPSLFVVGTVRSMYSVDDKTGNIRNVTFRNIEVISEDGRMPSSWVDAGAEGTVIENLTFENITLNGVKCGSAEEMKLKVGQNVIGLVIR